MAYELQVFFQTREVLPSQVLEKTLDACRPLGDATLARPSLGTSWVAGDLELNEHATGISIEIHSKDEGTDLAWQFASAGSDKQKDVDVTGLGILTLSGSVHSELLATVRAHWVTAYAALEFDEVDGFL